MSATSRQERRAAVSATEDEQMESARRAAREITHERTESARVVGGGVAGAGHEHEHEEEVRRGGIVETVQQGARSLVSAAVASRDAAAERPAVAESEGHVVGAGEGTTEEAAAEKTKNAEDTAGVALP